MQRPLFPRPLAPFLPPTLLLLLFLGLAPAMGEVRDFVFQLFPNHAVRYLAGAFALVALALGLWTVARIRQHRRLRYGALMLTGLFLWIQATGLGTGMAETDIVEKVHILQYGLIAFLLCRAMHPLAYPAAVLWVCCAAILTGTLEETVQWFAPRRTGEIRDVLINLAAGWTGVIFSFAWRPPESWSWSSPPGSWMVVRRTLAVALLVLGLFLSIAHLGHEIHDPRVGSFKSWHSAEQLHRIAAERAQEWSNNPPKDLPIWGVEDSFLTEAAWHAHHRNASQKIGDHVSAWQEHRILEVYYAPFLDLPRFRGSGVHRYSPDLRRKMRRRAGKPDLSGRTSPVLEGRVWPRPSKQIFFGMLFVTVFLLWWPIGRPTLQRRE